MKVVIKGTEKEIAAFVAELQKQQRSETVSTIISPALRDDDIDEHIRKSLRGANCLSLMLISRKEVNHDTIRING